MNIHRPVSGGLEEVRDDYVPASDYFSQEFADLENERLWPRVWQMVCRDQDIPKVGDFYTYDIVDDSITVIRTKPNEVKAFHNACPHRGRRLTTGCGHTARFHCKFHGWQFDLDGKPVVVVDRDDWGDKLKDEDITLMPVKIAKWAGWYYINMDPNSESLEEALAPAAAVLDPLDLAGLRYHWVKSTKLPCNWKVALEAFNEAYHLQQGHMQMLRYFDDVTTSHAHGRHSMFDYATALPPGLPSRRVGEAPPDYDVRLGLLDHVVDMNQTLNAGYPVMMGEAAERMMREVPKGTPVLEVLGKLQQFTMEDAASKGIVAPNVTPEQMAKVGADWHMFPNHILIAAPLALLTYRARPNGRDPDSCIWDVYSLLRYPPGKEPKVEYEWSDDYLDESFWGKILVQDFQNFPEVQKGLKSRGFRGSRTNPLQEVPVSNFHRALREFMAE
jgi:phenylpropionate dioxygenase-like ring-hydroxylating dioxygenase large terminal subunit